MRACMRGVAAALQRGRVGLLGLTKLGALSLLLAACSQLATLPIAATTGPSPTLSPPQHKLLPTVQVAAATGWPRGATPLAAPGLQVVAFAQGLEHPRWLLVLPNGDVLVAQSSEPPKPDDAQGIKGWVMGLFMKRAGAAVPSANSIALLRDTDGDGVADVREVLLAGLNSPFGMALIKDTLYVANTDAVLQFPYADGVTRINSSGIKLLDLPAGRINHHWTKNLIASLDGGQLYVAIGSNSNVAERGMAAEVGRAEIWQVDISTGVHRIFASGLRNPNGLVWQPRTGVLWTVVNERDELGNDLVPDYLTAVHAGDFYGWPYSYFGQHIDARVSPPRQDLVVSARVPDYALGAHTASLGLALANPSARSSALSARFTDGMFVGQHGSWNRSPPSGYKVIFVPFADGVPSGAPPMDVLTDFLGPDGNAQGRPVGVALDSHGGLLVADDVGNTVWRVSAAPVSGAMARAR